MTTQRPQTDLGDELTNLGIGLLIGAAVLALLFRRAGAVTAWVRPRALDARSRIVLRERAARAREALRTGKGTPSSRSVT